ncbi:MAG: hypothetical protein HY509_03580 [Acidobacteria bacterium]|nr:hypothetical protein [Acidobacteriota bacterium]
MRHRPTLFLFAAAMAFVEAAVVTYLRLHYPEAFRLPAVAIPPFTYAVEIGREVATLVMLWAVARVASADRWEGFLHFCFLFGVWDLFYYLWLRVLIGWPESLLTWDILFLIPVPWVAPVLAPVIVSLTLVAGSLHLAGLRRRGRPLRFSLPAWTGAILAAIVVVSSLLWRFPAVARGTIPAAFPWWWFLAGYFGGLAVYIRSVRKIPPAA